MPRAVRERQLLELAEELFAERGYAGASMDELARRAGVTKPVVYDIFGSKEGLYLACVERSAAQLRDARRRRHPRRRRASRASCAPACLAFLRFAVEHRVAWDVLFLTPDGRFADEAQAIRRRQAALVAELFAEIAARTSTRRRSRPIVTVVNGGSEALAGWAFEHPETSRSRSSPTCSSRSSHPDSRGSCDPPPHRDRRRRLLRASAWRSGSSATASTTSSILERADDLGGTWRDNTYPGCRCDVPSHLYSFSFAPNPDWSRTFSGQAEIWDYLRGVRRALRRRCRTCASTTRCTAPTWDDDAAALAARRPSQGPITADVLDRRPGRR